MPSSTFSFSGRVPSGPWGRTWLLALVAAAGILASLELYLRAQGHVPTVVDDPALWSYWRQQIKQGTSHHVVFIGSSRTQLAISPAEWRGVFPSHKVVQLALDGASSLPILEDVAGEAGFRGTVICEVTEYHIVRSFNYEERARSITHYYHSNWNPQKYLNRVLLTLVDQNLAIASPKKWASAAADIVHGRAPRLQPFYIHTLPDRSRQADYRFVDTSRQKRNWLEGRSVLPAGQELKNNGEWGEAKKRLIAAVARIQGRGGRVILLRLPTSGSLRGIEQRLFPKQDFWDEVMRETGAPAIHFEEVPSLCHFDCPDESHLDQKDAKTFTRCLAQEMRHRRLF